MHLIIGLGNPGSEYAKHRHNIGFMTVDALADSMNASMWTRKFGGEFCEARTATSKVYLLKPLTYMNLSGESVQKAAAFFKISPAQIIVFHDDLDLLPGKIRVKQGGGNGGHNGLKSIDAHLGKDYWRVRIGIGHPGDKDRVSDYVLSNFSKTEWSIQEAVIAAMTKHIESLLAENAPLFMSKTALELQSS